MMKFQNYVKKEKGFTLLEIVMVITLIGIITVVVSIPLMEGVKGWSDVTTREGITQSGRIAMERMVREIRNTAKTCINTATATTFTFGSDLSNCSAINFSQSGSAIQRNGVDLADNIQSLEFKYYDASNITTAVTADIRRVTIEIVSASGGETVRKYSEVYLVNM